MKTHTLLFFVALLMAVTLVWTQGAARPGGGAAPLLSRLARVQGAERPERTRLLARADSLTRLMRYEEAATLLSVLLARDAQDVAALAQLSNVHFLSGNNADAKNGYRILAQLRPEEPFYRIRLAQVHYRLEEYAEAVGAGKSVLTRDEIPSLRMLVGNAFNQLKQPDSALVCYRKVLSRNPLHQKAVLGISKILLDRKDYASAIAVCQGYLDSARFEMHAPEAVRRGARFTQELRDSTTFTCDVPQQDALPVLQTRGLAEYLMQEHPASTRTFEMLLAAGDDSYGTHYYLGLNYLEGLSYLAGDQFAAAYAIDSSDVNLVVNYAKSTIFRKGHPGEFNPGSRRLFDRALKMMEPDSSRMFNILYNYAAAFHKLEDFASAIPYYRSAWAYNPSAILCLSNIGYCCERRKDWKNAKVWYEKYLAVGRPGTRGYDYVVQALKYVNSQLMMEE